MRVGVGGYVELLVIIFIVMGERGAGSRHQPDIWGLTKGMLQKLQRLYILVLKTIPLLVQQNVGLVRAAISPSLAAPHKT